MDVTITDMQDHKFTAGEQIDKKLDNKDHVENVTVDHVLDELINLKSTVLQNGQESTYNDWVSTYSNKLLPGGVYAKLHRVRHTNDFQNEFEKEK